MGASLLDVAKSIYYIYEKSSPKRNHLEGSRNFCALSMCMETFIWWSEIAGPSNIYFRYETVQKIFVAFQARSKEPNLLGSSELNQI